MSNTEGTKRRVGGKVVRQEIDLTDHLNIDEFDSVVTAIEAVVNGAESLSLDDPRDRQKLRDRLLFALGGEPQP